MGLNVSHCFGRGGSAVGDADDSYTLPSCDLEGVAAYIENKARRIIVMAGAGMSTSAGIPDFRTPGSGLYDNLQKYNLPRPESMFELSFFKRSPEPFYDLVGDMWPGRYRPTPSHYFLRLLHERGLLLRVYTQNIDSLEAAAGVPVDRVIAAHGNFDSCHVVTGPRAGSQVPTEEVRAALAEGGEGWRALADRHGGLVKPAIVMFGEQLPDRFFRFQREDFGMCDLLIVMGTSLKVYPFAGLVDLPRPTCPRVLINREKVGSSFDFNNPEAPRDVFHEADCDSAVLELCKRLGWEEELARLQESEAPAKPRAKY